jgi:hypothetical protein
MLTSEGHAQPAGHGFHPPRPDQPLYFYCRIELGKEVLESEVPLQLKSSLARTEFDQAVKIAPSLPTIHLREYLPRTVLEQRAVPDKGADAGRAIQISIDGPTQSYQRWLVANDTARNRLTSFIATWRYMAVDSPRDRKELLDQFTNELTRDPKVLVKRTDTGRSAEVPATPGTVWPLKDLECKISIKTFLPDFVIDTKTGRPRRQSDKQVNPAALIEIEYKGQREDRWVFAKFPEFRSEEASFPFKAALDCPLEKQGQTPDFLLMTVGVDAHEVWIRQNDEVTVKPLAPDEACPIAGSQYEFRIADYLASARLVEEYKADDEHGTVAALRIETDDPAGNKNVLWLELGKQRLIPTSHGPISAVFGPHRPRSARNHP